MQKGFKTVLGYYYKYVIGRQLIYKLDNITVICFIIFFKTKYDLLYFTGSVSSKRFYQQITSIGTWIDSFKLCKNSYHVTVRYIIKLSFQQQKNTDYIIHEDGFKAHVGVLFRLVPIDIRVNTMII